MTVQTQLKARGWYLEHRDAGHFKFYTALLIEDGTAVYHWGRLGTKGQYKIERTGFGTAQNSVLRKVAEKESKGYEMRHEDVAWTVDERDVDGANGLGRERPDPGRLTMLFDRALRDPAFTGDKDSVLVGYDALLVKAQALMDKAAAGTLSYDSAMNDFEDLKQSWTEIGEMHGRVETTISLTQQMLMQAMVSGKLG